MEFVALYTEEEWNLIDQRRRKAENQYYRTRHSYDKEFRKACYESYLKWNESNKEKVRKYNLALKKKQQQMGLRKPPSEESKSRMGINQSLRRTRGRRGNHKMTKQKMLELLMAEEKRRAENLIDKIENGDRKQIIFCIVGESGAGKTLASLHLKYKRQANVVCSFTTRLPRKGEVEGREHYFVDIVPPEDTLLAYTQFGCDSHKYYATKSQVQGAVTVYVIDEKGLLDLKERFGDVYELYSIYMKRSKVLKLASGVDETRAKRDLRREHLDESVYNEVFENNGTKEELFEYIEKVYDKLLVKSKEYGW